MYLDLNSKCESLSWIGGGQCVGLNRNHINFVTLRLQFKNLTHAQSLFYFHFMVVWLKMKFYAKLKCTNFFCSACIPNLVIISEYRGIMKGLSLIVGTMGFLLNRAEPSHTNSVISFEFRLNLSKSLRHELSVPFKGIGVNLKILSLTHFCWSCSTTMVSYTWDGRFGALKLTQIMLHIFQIPWISWIFENI